MIVSTKYAMSFITGRTMTKMKSRDFIDMVVAVSPHNYNAEDIDGLMIATMHVVQSTMEAYIKAFPKYREDINKFNELTADGITNEAINEFIDYAETKYGPTIDLQPIHSV